MKADKIVMHDLTSVFDIVEHAILLSVLLKDLGINAFALDWFSSHHSDHSKLLSMLVNRLPHTLLRAMFLKG